MWLESSVIYVVAWLIIGVAIVSFVILSSEPICRCPNYTILQLHIIEPGFIHVFFVRLLPLFLFLRQRRVLFGRYVIKTWKKSPLCECG
jgi:hypothetical protein